MSLSEESLELLMAYADGELEGDELARAERLLAESPEAARVVADLGVLGTAVRSAEDARAEAARIDDIADVVMERIAAEAQPAPVVDLAARRRRRTAMIGAAIALAAGVALVVRGSASPTQVASTTQVSTTQVSTAQVSTAQGAPVPPSSAALAAGGNLVAGNPVAGNPVAGNPGPGMVDDDPSGVEVENVESSESSVSVFYLPAVAGARINASSVVVWITDPPAQGDL